MSLPSSIQRVADTIVAFYRRPVGAGPYQVYQYLPAAEFKVRRDLLDLKAWLGANGVSATAISLADLLWEAIDSSGRMEAIARAERTGRTSDLDDAIDSIGALLRRAPSLSDRIVAAVDGLPPKSAVFLYRAGALYPAMRTSGLLDELLDRVRMPVTMLYPGRLYGSNGLSFLDICEAHYGYRAAIISRGDDE